MYTDRKLTSLILLPLSYPHQTFPGEIFSFQIGLYNMCKISTQRPVEIWRETTAAVNRADGRPTVGVVNCCWSWSFVQPYITFYSSKLNSELCKNWYNSESVVHNHFSVVLMTAAKTIVRTKLGRQGVGLRVHKHPNILVLSTSFCNRWI